MYIFDTQQTEWAQNETLKEFEGLTMHDIESELFDHDLLFLSDNEQTLDISDILE